MNRFVTTLSTLLLLSACGETPSEEPTTESVEAPSPEPSPTPPAARAEQAPERQEATATPQPPAEGVETEGSELDPDLEQDPEAIAEETNNQPAETEAPSNAPISIGAATLGTQGELTLRRLEIATGIEEREPVGVSQRFSSANEQITAFLNIRNDGEEAKSVRVLFERPDGSRMQGLSLEIPAGATRWRTWARSRNIRAPGLWHAVVETSDAEEIGRCPFEITTAAEGGS